MRSLSRKQVAADSRLWVRVPRLPLTTDDEQRLAQRTGSWSNSKTPVLQTGDPGATPGESIESRERRVKRQEPEEVTSSALALDSCLSSLGSSGSVVQRRRLPAYTRKTMVRVHPESVIGFCPRGAAGVLATLSRWRSWVQIPSRTPLKTARYAIRQSGEVQTFVFCGFDSHSCQ